MNFEISTTDTTIIHEPPLGTFMLGYRGSHAHNLYVPKEDPLCIDDIDLMGFVIGSRENYFGLSEWGSRGTKEYWEGRLDLVYYEIRKAFAILLQGNPNIMAMLWMRRGHYLLLGHFGRLIIDHREMFVGKHVYKAFAGYASAQLQKMETRDPAELREYIWVTNELKRRGSHPNHKGEEIQPPEDHPAQFADWGLDKLMIRLKSFQKKGENLGYMGDKRKQLVLNHGYDAKNAAHCIRLLRMCKEFLRDGAMQVYRTTDREELLDIKAGRWTLEHIKQHAEELFADVKAERDRSKLPDEPNRKGAEGLLVSILSEEFQAGK